MFDPNLTNAMTDELNQDETFILADHRDEMEELRRIEEEMEIDRDFDDSMDGDFDSGMASAGFGTDEDYGGCIGGDSDLYGEY